MKQIELWQIVGGDTRYLMEGHAAHPTSFVEGRIRGALTVLVREAGDDSVGFPRDENITSLWESLAAIPYDGLLKLTPMQARGLRAGIARTITERRERSMRTT